MVYEKEILEYLNREGKSTFQYWLIHLKDTRGRAVIRKKINQLRLGYVLNVRSLGDDLFEIRVFFGPGYRIYFGQVNKKTIILLLGGDKGSQKRDIEKAKKYWKLYKGVQNG